MAFGFPAYASQKHSLNMGPEYTSLVVRETLERLGWKYEMLGANRFVAFTSLSFWSYGERVVIDGSPDGIVSVRSQCRLVTQCVDWGKNDTNVREFFDRAALVAPSYRALPSPIASYDEDGRTPLERARR